jgi:prefoldin beta subunit
MKELQQLQMLEQNVQVLMMQRQNFEQQLAEAENAARELDSSKESFRIVGSIMLSVDKESLKKELKQKKDELGLRIASIEKQEEKVRERALQLRKEVVEKHEKGTGK